MIDFGSLLHAPAYSIYGTTATLTLASGGAPIPLTVIDKSSGLEVLTEDGHEGGIRTTTLVPAALVRVSDLTAAGVTRKQLRRATLEMNGKSYRVENSLPRPVASGEADGELALFLIED